MGRIQSSWVQEGIVLALRAFPYLALVHAAGRLGHFFLEQQMRAPSSSSSPILALLHWPFRFHWAVEALLLVEGAFLLYIRWRHDVLCRADRSPPQLSPAEREQVFERMLRHTEDMKVRARVCV
jgi:hypothetical protein